MLNLNLIMNGAKYLTTETGSSNSQAEYNWDFDERTVAIDEPNLTHIANASFTLNANNSNAINVTSDSGNVFNSIEDFPVTASISGSGQWPTTGSVTMSLYIAAPGGTVDNLPYFFTGVVTCSAAEGNISAASSSIISNEFTSSKNFIYFVSASIIHHKGNEYNPLVTYLATGSQTSSWNNNTYPIAELDIIKDANVFISASILKTPALSSSFQYDYNFGITASLTASANWPTSQSYLYPTMSLSIPEAGVSVQSYTTSSVITASFAANKNTPYTITGSAWANMIPKINSTILAVAAGAGGQPTYEGPNQLGGSGGGAGEAYQINNFEIVPNRVYSYNVGTASLAASGLTGRVGQDLSLTGFGISNSAIVSMSLKLQGGRTGSLFGAPNTANSYTLGGDGGSGSYTIGASTTLLTKRNGGTGSWNATYGGIGAGGGGSNTAGGNSTFNTIGGTGGNGLSSTILGTTYLFGAGGGGAGANINPAQSYQGAGGTTGGGRGGNNTVFTGTDGTFYGAGGGGGNLEGENTGYGSNGVVIIQYQGKPKLTFSGGVITETSLAGVTTHYINSGSGTFIYNYEPIPDPNLGETFFAETLVVAGGGAGSTDIGGGGGAGGCIVNYGTYINYNNTYTVTVGAGSPSYYTNPFPYGGKIRGDNSALINNTTGLQYLAFGGGNGGRGATFNAGYIGGSGGGGKAFGGEGGATTGSNQGFAGGNAANEPYANGGGGGGALTTGSNGYQPVGSAPGPFSGAGGLGKYSLDFIPIGVAGGGQGAGPGSDATGSFAFGGGASGAETGSNGLPNTGGGGGALYGIRGENDTKDSGAGGSGLVQIRYIGNPIATGGTITQGIISGSIYTLHTFYSSSQFIPISGSRPVPTY